MRENFKRYFFENFYKNGLEAYVNAEIEEKFWNLTQLMLKTNEVMNITAITDIEKIIPLHYADCVKIAELIPENALVADIGCGGGFPILPLAIVRPDLKLLGIDSTEKKAKYVAETGNKLRLNVKTVAGRAEELAKQPDLRQNFDVVVSRAVARLNILNELCMPFTKIGGRFITMKGAAGMQEFEEAKTGIQKLGGVLDEVEEYDLYLNEQSEKRTIFIIMQERSISTTYPRAFASIKKKPL